MARVERIGVPGTPGYRVELYPRRGRVALTAAGAVVFVLLGAWLLTFGEVRPVVAGAAAVLFFGIVAVLLARRSRDRSPALVIDRDGLHDNASALAAGLVPWGQITGIGTLEVWSQRMLAVQLVDPEPLLARLGPVRGRVARANLQRYGAAVHIPQNMLPITVDEVCAEIQRFRGRP